MEQETKIEQLRFEESQLSLVRTSQVEWRLVRHFSRRFNSYIVDRIADKRFRPRQNVALFARCVRYPCDARPVVKQALYQLILPILLIDSMYITYY